MQSCFSQGVYIDLAGESWEKMLPVPWKRTSFRADRFERISKFEGCCEREGG